MSQSGEERPLSRRERRLQETAARSGDTAKQNPAAAASASEAHSEFEPEISLTNPDGTPRTRRELRALREEAIAEYESLRLASTQAFSAQDLKDAVASETADSQSTIEADSLDVDTDAVDTDKVDTDAVNTGEVDTDAADRAESLDADLDAADEEAAEYEAAEREAVELEYEDNELGDDDEVDHADGDDDASEDVEGEDGDDDLSDEDAPAGEVAAEEQSDETSEHAPQPAKQDGYSFPDIAPLDDSSSVFDTPDSPSALRAAEPAETSDFDDLITSAVAQEGSGGSTNTSALILPDMSHTGQLTGPLGETGELFITGSFELPKSLGETGGHSRHLDSVDSDGEESTEVPQGEGGIAPVAASNAVSARSTSSFGSRPEKEKSKLPKVLIATGGGLIVVIAGLAVWATSTGFFG